VTIILALWSVAHGTLATVTTTPGHFAAFLGVVAALKWWIVAVCLLICFTAHIERSCVDIHTEGDES